jgi:hypothetical protein
VRTVCFSLIENHWITFCINGMDSMPRWSGLNHFGAIMHVSFTDGSKNEDISKVCYFLPPILDQLQKFVLACYICNTHRTSWRWYTTWLSLATMLAQLCGDGHVCCFGGSYYWNHHGRSGWSSQVFGTHEGGLFSYWTEYDLRQAS